MFVRLARPVRDKAGWFAALLYLFCVLAPGVALALGDAASCLMHRSEAAAAHVHEAAQEEHGAAHQHHEMQTDQHAMHLAGGVTSDPAQHRHDGKASVAPCCAMLCVSAIAADPPAIARPSQPMSICASENVQRLPGEASPQLFRPPIA